MGYQKIVVTDRSSYYDISELVEQTTWGGRKGAAPRSVTVSLLDDDGYTHERIPIVCEDGWQCIFYWKEEELFRGLIMSTGQSDTKKMTFTAYDNAVYLANNDDSFSFKNKRASDIFTHCMTRIGATVGTVDDTGYVIPELIKPKTKIYDVLLDSLSTTYKNTGIRHYIFSDKGVISLKRRIENTIQWVIEPGANLITYSYTNSIQDIKTRFRLLSKEGKVIAERTNADLESKIGIFGAVDELPEKYNSAQIDELIDSMIKENGYPKKSLTVTALGLPDVISGKCVYISIPKLNIVRSFYVDEDKHVFKGNYHKMTVKLNFATDISTIE